MEYEEDLPGKQIAITLHKGQLECKTRGVSLMDCMAMIELAKAQILESVKREQQPPEITPIAASALRGLRNPPMS